MCVQLVTKCNSASEPELITRKGEGVHTCNICASVLQWTLSQASHYSAEGAHNNTHIFKQSVSRNVLLELRFVEFVGDPLAVEYISTVYAPSERIDNSPIDSSRHLLG